jgi:hypothetical protein
MGIGLSEAWEGPEALNINPGAEAKG